MDEAKFNALKKEWQENRDLATEHNRRCGVALREIIYTLQDEGMNQADIGRLLGVNRRRVNEIIVKRKVFAPGYEDLHKEPGKVPGLV